ncbi:hypothetical protein Dvina_16350 [Dactylosporangium vinaceum]|uniref:Lipoprotein n=1 Tax=Dactylosporangium vinaceum TaxID=53362 RepID=A0ABV5M902_9ACTN|nr:hypothetical protein [Dactylosporangium vinaceum]UAB99497.1 hypothetical protein Dvina_16350 [Dactylosporangium vinaceum]
MKHIAVVLAGALTLGTLAGCDVSVSTSSGKAKAAASSAPSAPPVPPREALANAVQALDTVAYNFGIKQGDTSGGGRVDHTAHAALVDLNGSLPRGDGTSVHIALAYTIVAPDMWVKADFGDGLNQKYDLQPGTWIRVDRTKATGTSHPVDANGNPKIGFDDLLADLADVKQTDKTHFTGTVDLTDVDGILSPTSVALKNAGDKAKALPFTATLDDRGRLATFTIDGSGADADLSTQLTFTGYGSVAPVAAPTSAVEASAKVYELLG